MNSPITVNKLYYMLDYFSKEPKVQSVYALLPSIRNDASIFKWLAFREHDGGGNINKISASWLMLMRFWKELIELEYNRPIDLQLVYDALGWKFPYNWKTPNLPVVGEKNPDGIVKWADIDAMSETQYKAIIYALKKSGALPQDFPDYPDIKYINGVWNVNWQEKAKENPQT